jgi:DNA transformation protein
MARRSEFIEHVVGILARFGAVEVRRMFGGWGFYHRGTFFALAADDTLYFKTDDENRARFDERGLPPFAFMKRGERIETHYRQAPEEALENPDEMADWARSAYGAALRAQARKRKPTPSRTPAARRRRAAGPKA